MPNLRDWSLNHIVKRVSVFATFSVLQVMKKCTSVCKSWRKHVFWNEILQDFSFIKSCKIFLLNSYIASNFQNPCPSRSMNKQHFTLLEGETVVKHKVKLFCFNIAYQITIHVWDIWLVRLASIHFYLKAFSLNPNVDKKGFIILHNVCSISLLKIYFKIY